MLLITGAVVSFSVMLTDVTFVEFVFPALSAHDTDQLLADPAMKPVKLTELLAVFALVFKLVPVELTTVFRYLITPLTVTLHVDVADILSCTENTRFALPFVMSAFCNTKSLAAVSF